MWCHLHGDESVEEVQRRVWRGPRALCLRGGEGETACERSGFDGFHSVRWCLLWQRHYGGRSCIAVAFSVRCGLLLLDLYRRRVAFAGFDDYMGGMLAVAVGNEGELKF